VLLCAEELVENNVKIRQSSAAPKKVLWTIMAKKKLKDRYSLNRSVPVVDLVNVNIRSLFGYRKHF